MLYIIATPIGNLGDITKRALDIFEQLDILLCEDTRKAGLLLQNLKIANRPKLVSFYDEVEQQKVPQVVEMLREGLEVGLVTDAGTPLISDPGWLLVKKCQEFRIKYTSIPGASAAINGLVLSGLPASRFCFLGFLPKKEGDIKKIFRKYKDFEGTKIVFESPLRITKTIGLVKDVWGERTEIRIVREMTKKFEEILKPEEVVNNKGEVVILWN